MPDPTSARRCGVLLDVDGTLVDSNYLHTLAWSRALRRHGEWATMRSIHRLIGMGSDQLLPELIGRTDDEIDRTRSEEYRPLLDEVVACPGATDLVNELHRLGLVMVLATSSPAEDLDVLVDRLGIGPVVDGRTTIDDVERSKPDPQMFTAAMRVGDLTPERTLALGDSRWDVEAATAAGIGCVAVETGGTSADELLDAGALAVYKSCAQLLGQLRASPFEDLLQR